MGVSELGLSTYHRTNLYFFYLAKPVSQHRSHTTHKPIIKEKTQIPIAFFLLFSTRFATVICFFRFQWIENEKKKHGISCIIKCWRFHINLIYHHHHHQIQKQPCPRVKQALPPVTAPHFCKPNTMMLPMSKELVCVVLISKI